MRSALLLALVLGTHEPARSQDFSTSVTAPYRIPPRIGVTYMKSGAWEGKLDVYWRSDPGPHPTLIWIHGGGPTGGSREAALFYLLPYLERGWNVVNVEHRLAGVTLAPAALQNSLCAVRWVVQNAKSFNSDSARLVISGDSSGGWFAVAAGLGVRPPGWDQACPGPEEPKVAAVVNWYGNWDLADILDGPNKKPYAAGWVANLPDGVEVARSMLPLPLRPNVPPVISVHGDDDGTVPYTQSVRLHEALKQAGIPQQLVTIPGGKHGGFSRDESRRAFAAIDAFLDRVGLRPQPSKQQ